MNEIKYLIEDCQLTIKDVSKRMNISYNRLLKVWRNINVDPTFYFRKYRSTDKYKKLHNRARDVINESIINSEKPIQISDLIKLVHEKA